jgi:hypothetical protein
MYYRQNIKHTHTKDIIQRVHRRENRREKEIDFSNINIDIYMYIDR